MKTMTAKILFINIYVILLVTCEKLKFRGDTLILEDSSISMENSWISDKNKLWHNGILDYYLHHSFSHDEKENIKTAMESMKNQLAPGCLTFHELDKRPTQQSFLDIQPGDSCRSEIGRAINRGNIIHLNSKAGCMNQGTIIHEIMHSLGARHEHSRPDRDMFVRVNMENIKSEMISNFKKYNDSCETFETPYDYYSIMHYSDRHAHAINASVSTIDAIYLDDPLSSEKTSLSPTDIMEISKAYSCVVNPETKKLYEEYVAELYNCMHDTVMITLDKEWKDCDPILDLMEDLISEASVDKREIFQLKLALVRNKMDSKKAMHHVETQLNNTRQLIKEQNKSLTTQEEKVRKYVDNLNHKMKKMNADNKRKLQSFWREIERTLKKLRRDNPDLGNRTLTSYRRETLYNNFG